MTMQDGSLFLLKVGDGEETEMFTTVAGLIATGLSLNQRPHETTNLTSGKWRTLLEDSGISAVSISASGLFTDDVSEEVVRNHAFACTIANYQIHFASGNVLQGPFAISAYTRSGGINGEEAVSLTLESAGAITFS